MKQNFAIRPFNQSDQAAVEKLVLMIQRDEFGLDLSADNQPDLKNIAGFFSQIGSAFWVAVAASDGTLIGCIGLEAIGGPVAVMRKFMVHQDWRGRELGVADALHTQFVEHARLIGALQAALSTVSSTKAAQSFYSRAGYRIIKCDAMPTGFIPGVLDVVFMVSEV